MRTRNWFVVVGLAVLVGCGKTVTINEPDGTSVEMPAEEYRAQQHEAFMMSFQGGLAGLLQNCGDPGAQGVSEGEYRDCLHNNQLIAVQVPYMLQAAGGTNAGYWQLAAKKEDRPFRIANTAINGIQTLGMMGLLPWGTSYGGGGSFDISAKDQGSIIVDSSSFGNKSPVARDEATIANDDSALATEDALAATSDGQIQTGDGNQQQAGTDPTIQPGFDQSAGDEGTAGDNNINTQFTPSVGIE